LEKLLRGPLDSVAFIRNPENKSQVVKSLGKGLHLARIEDAEEGYENVLGIYERKIYPASTAFATSSASTSFSRFFR